MQEQREERSLGRQRHKLRKHHTYRSQGDGPDYSSVFAKCVISCWAGHRRMNAAEVGEEARNWEAGGGGGWGRSSCQQERKSCWIWRQVVTKKSRSSYTRSWMTGRQGEGTGSIWSVRWEG